MVFKKIFKHYLSAAQSKPLKTSHEENIQQVKQLRANL